MVPFIQQIAGWPGPGERESDMKPPSKEELKELKDYAQTSFMAVTIKRLITDYNRQCWIVRLLEKDIDRREKEGR